MRRLLSSARAEGRFSSTRSGAFSSRYDPMHINEYLDFGGEA